MISHKKRIAKKEARLKTISHCLPPCRSFIGRLSFCLVRPGKQIGAVHFRITRLDAGKDLGTLRVGAEATYEWSVSVDDLDLPDGVAALSPIKEVEAQATLTFTLEDGVLTAELTGRVSGLGDLPSKQVTVTPDDMAKLGHFIEQAYKDAIGDLLKKLEDPFGNLPILGDALRFLYGLADESLGRLLDVADAHAHVKAGAWDRAALECPFGVPGQVRPL